MSFYVLVVFIVFIDWALCSLRLLFPITLLCHLLYTWAYIAWLNLEFVLDIEVLRLFTMNQPISLII